METTSLSGPALRAWLAERNISVARFARAADLFLPEAYMILNGNEKVGPTRRARIEAALDQLEREATASKRA